MANRSKIFIPSTSDIKILRTVSYLNDLNLYPLSQGVYKILSGSSEEEFKEYSVCPTFGTLLSYGSKHVSRLIMMLLRNDYLEKKYDVKTNELYLKITGKGIKFLNDYDKKHKYLFKKKENNCKTLIVKIND